MTRVTTHMRQTRGSKQPQLAASLQHSTMLSLAHRQRMLEKWEI
jgi:hypothetical protein